MISSRMTQYWEEPLTKKICNTEYFEIGLPNIIVHAFLQTKGGGGVVAFTSLNPANKVQRVSALSGGADYYPTTDYDPELVGYASDVANIKARLDRN